MNPSEHRLDRLLNAAKRAAEPVPKPSAWFEQRLRSALKREQATALFETSFVLRFLGAAALLPVLSLLVVYLESENPYLEAVEWANPTTQIEKIN